MQYTHYHHQLSETPKLEKDYLSQDRPISEVNFIGHCSTLKLSF